MSGSGVAPGGLAAAAHDVIARLVMGLVPVKARLKYFFQAEPPLRDELRAEVVAHCQGMRAAVAELVGRHPALAVAFWRHGAGESELLGRLWPLLRPAIALGRAATATELEWRWQTLLAAWDEHGADIEAAIEAALAALRGEEGA